MRVSTRGDYAARALLSLALHTEEAPTSVREIAERTALPQPYLEQILLALKGAGIVRSKRGVGGGYVLARDPGDIRLSEIVRAVDGPITAGDFGEPSTMLFYSARTPGYDGAPVEGVDLIFDLTGSYRAAFVHGIAWNMLNIALVLLLMWRVKRVRRVRRRVAGMAMA